VWGGHRVFTVDGHRSLRRRIPITISLGEPLLAQQGETVDELSARLHTVMESLLEGAITSYPDKPTGDDDRWWLPLTHGGTAPDVETAAILDREAVARLGDSFE
jgi:hypothetical protein